MQNPGIDLPLLGVQDPVYVHVFLERRSGPWLWKAVAEWGNTRTGKWEGVDEGVGGGKRAYGTFAEW